MKNRQQLLAIIAGLAIALFFADRFVITPLTNEMVSRTAAAPSSGGKTSPAIDTANAARPASTEIDVATCATTRSDVVQADAPNRAALLTTCRHHGWFLMPCADASCRRRAAMPAARCWSS